LKNGLFFLPFTNIYSPLLKFNLMEKFTQGHELSEKTLYIILILGVLIYLAFILYREMNGLG